MICRRCKTAWDARRSRVCPRCGTPRARPAFLKTSTIFISTGSTERVYRSLDEVPGALRAKLLDCTNGANSGTILIADRKGRREIARAVRRIPAAKPGTLRALVRGATRGAGVPRPSAAALRHAAGIAFVVLTALFVWAVLGRPGI